MDSMILLNMLVLGGTAFVAAFILYIVSQKFKVEKDPLESKILSALPQANCGGCGKAGCSAFAKACFDADAEAFKELYCPVGGSDVMQKVAKLKGFEISSKTPTVAVLRCQGTCQNAPAKVLYDEMSSCRIANRVSVGETGCPDGCLHLGDCVKVCKFGALSFDKETEMPVVDSSKCVSCGACVKACPRGLFEIRPLSKKGTMVYVACRNKQKGAAARKNCAKACIGCMKCTKVHESILVEDNLSYIPVEVEADKFGAELRETCPTGAIVYKEKAHD